MYLLNLLKFILLCVMYIPLVLILQVSITLLTTFTLDYYLEQIFILESNHPQALHSEYIFLFPYITREHV